MGMEQEQTPHKRRVRYKGEYPKKYEEKYKELQPEKYGGTIAHVISKGNTPAEKHYQRAGVSQRAGRGQFRLYAQEAAGIMVQRIYGIFRETAADRHFSRCGLRRV